MLSYTNHVYKDELIESLSDLKKVKRDYVKYFRFLTESYSMTAL